MKSEIYPRQIVATPNRLFLIGFDSNGRELWTSDGTEAGTRIVKDIFPGEWDAFQANNFNYTMGVIGTSIVFIANDGSATLKVWRSDGSESGTQAVREIGLSSTSVAPAMWSAAGHGFFTVQGALWRTDGTNAGTILLNNTPSFNPGAFASTPTALYFRARTDGVNYRLWKSDGTLGGTVEVAPDVKLQADVQLRHANGKLYFAGASDATGIEPWTSDGTTAGTSLLANLMTDPAPSSNPENLRASGNQVFFDAAGDGSATHQLWRSDGTASGTVGLTQFPEYSPSPRSSAAWNGLLFFDYARQLWRTDGTVEGTTLLADLEVSTFFAGSNYLYFSDYYEGMWRTDGTAAGTIQLSDTTMAELVGEIAGRFYFFSDGTGDGILWQTDGTVESTRQVASLGDFPLGPVIMGGALYYVNASVNPNYELWRNDGTADGSSLVKEIRPGIPGSNPRSLTPAGSLLYFLANDGTTGEELWRTDGTEAGTFLLKDILPGAESSAPSSLVAVNGNLYFSANNGIDGAELWTSNGTIAGTVLVEDLAPGAASSAPHQTVAADGAVWFAATTSSAGTELWTSNGTAHGTLMVSDLEPGGDSSSPGELTAAGRRLYFSATTSLGRELWAMDLASSAFSINDARVVEGDSGTQQLRFTVTRSGDLSQAATVAYATARGSATAGSDFTSRSGSLPFASGVATAFVDVQIVGDGVIEKNESFFVKLSAPSTGAIERGIGTGTIEDEDTISALSVTFLQTGTEDRTLVVTNAGPSSATGVQVRFIDSPGDSMFIKTGEGPSCASSSGTTLCSLGTLLAGESRTLTLNRTSDPTLYWDLANPPGQTSTAIVTATEFDPDLSDNTVARMFSRDGLLMTTPFLVANTTSTLEFLSPSSQSTPLPVTLSSTNPIVVASPPTATIPAGQRGTTFSLQVGNGVGTTKLDTDLSSAMVIPIVSTGSTPKLDTIMTGPSSMVTFPYGQNIEIPIRVLARTAGGALPTGQLQLLDESGTVLAEATLHQTAAILTHSGVTPGTYTYRVRYLGDANFNPLTVTHPPYEVRGWRTSTTMVLPQVICGNMLDVVITVQNLDGTAAPTGQVRLTFQGQQTLLQLVPTGEPGRSKATTEIPLPQPPAHSSINASYLATGTFENSARGDSLDAVAGCAPIAVSATAVTTTRVDLTWTSTGASSYEVHRGESYGWTYVGNAATNSYVDTGVQANRTYIYRVRPVGGLLSNPDIATTFFFSNDPIGSGITKIQAVHLLELRTAANLARSAARLLPSLAIGTPPATAGAIRAFHINELRAAIDEARKFIGLPQINYTDPTLPAGMLVKTAHVQELRNALK
ncbi:MAG TPA: ELWxxDGT repeat protein [Thermoanaerobaculia bacterium]|nr:ELWxxDGT repeat protein [Thermoanaerobaculia bacterium]